MPAMPPAKFMVPRAALDNPDAIPAAIPKAFCVKTDWFTIGGPYLRVVRYLKDRGVYSPAGDWDGEAGKCRHFRSASSA